MIKDISTGVGTSTTPSGLAHISAYVATSDLDNTVEYVYGGDLQGNLWRFNLMGNSSNSWDVEKIATLVDSANVAQPITTVPELGVVQDKRMVFVGTGKYLGDTDIPAPLTTPQTQTFYGLVDDLSTAPLISPLRSSLQQQTFTTSADFLYRTASSTTVDYNTKKGWFIDLPDNGERSVTNPLLALGAIIFTSNIPSTDACAPGGSSWIYFLDYETGGFIAGSTVSWSGKSLGNALASEPVLITLEDGTKKILVKESDGGTSVLDTPFPPSTSGVSRVSWREIITE